ncbi:hypothetical protein BKA63DRAFT_518501 [Paraphoma chrysanthemicola]|nr:hypothetical protein BKA63DRAFT_518501 [Paraphoma chrysanthemicola]
MALAYVRRHSKHCGSATSQMIFIWRLSSDLTQKIIFPPGTFQALARVHSQTMTSNLYNFNKTEVYYAFSLNNCSDVMALWKYFAEPFPFGERYPQRAYNLTITALGSFMREHSLRAPKYPDGFSTWIQNVQIDRRVQDHAKEKCLVDYCRTIGWDGNPDIAGIGMLATYVIQAMLVTIYLIGVITIRSEILLPKLRTVPSLFRVLVALKHSVVDLLSACFLFSIAMLFAGSISLLREIPTFTMYVLIISMPVSSVLPTILLQFAGAHLLRRSRGRILAWCVVLALAITLFVGTIVAYFNQGRALQDELKFERECLWPTISGLIAPMAFYSWAIAGLQLLGISAYIVGLLKSQRKYSPNAFAWLPRNVWWTLLGLTFCAMWTSIGLFLRLTLRIQDLVGEDNKDTEWSFGQVLALATWMPSIVEFVYIWWEAPEEALNGRLIDPYEVCETSGGPRDLEMRHAEDERDRGEFRRLVQSGPHEGSVRTW